MGSRAVYGVGYFLNSKYKRDPINVDWFNDKITTYSLILNLKFCGFFGEIEKFLKRLKNDFFPGNIVHV